MRIRAASKEHIHIHPTQKSVALDKWLLINYAIGCRRILDTHLGSGSIAVAYHELGFGHAGYEIDKGYFDSVQQRLQRFQAQQRFLLP